MSDRHRAQKTANRKKARRQGKTGSSSEPITPPSSSSVSSFSLRAAASSAASSTSSSLPRAPGGVGSSPSTAPPSSPRPPIPGAAAAAKIPYVATVYTHELGATERESGHCVDLADLKRRINRMVASPIDAFRCYVPACGNGCRSMLSTVTGLPRDPDANRSGGSGGGGGGGSDGAGDRKTEIRMPSATAKSADAYASYRVVSIPVCGLADNRHLQAHAILAALTGSRQHAAYYDDEHCHNCLKTHSSPAMYACPRCARVRYCDAGCARLAWPTHAGDCVPIGGPQPRAGLSAAHDAVAATDRETAPSPPFPSASAAHLDSSGDGGGGGSSSASASATSLSPPA